VRDLPAGTVTFLFTDIEGSTRLLRELGERYGGHSACCWMGLEQQIPLVPGARLHFHRRLTK